MPTRCYLRGNMDYAPNVDAVQYFVQDLYPRIKESNPEVKLIIAGQRPVEAVLKLRQDDIEVTGFVPDLADMYRGASVVIAPLRFGAGTQNKVLEAMAMGVPAVCTDVGFKGLEISSGEGVVYAPSGDDFVKAVNTLLASGDRREEVGQLGLEVARSRFSWEGISSEHERLWQEVSSVQVTEK